MNIIGIDTGREGGIAWIGKGQIVRVWRTPLSKKKIDWPALGEIFRKIARMDTFEWAMEKVMPFPSKDTKGKPFVMNSTQIMVENYGRYKLLLEQAGIPDYAEYPAWQWRRGYKFSAKKNTTQADLPGETGDKIIAANRANKIASMRIANAIWPFAAGKFGKDWHDGTGEAALIAEYHHRVKSAERMNP